MIVLYFFFFSGKEAVNWMMLHKQSFPNSVKRRLSSRRDAVEIGQEMVKMGMVSHITHQFDFSDSDLLYMFCGVSQIIPNKKEKRITFSLTIPYLNSKPPKI